MATQKLSCTNSRKELRRCCLPIGHNNTKHFLCPIRTRIRMTVWRWSSESRYPGSLPPVLENFRRAYFSPGQKAAGPTDCPLFSEDASEPVLYHHAKKERCVTG